MAAPGRDSGRDAIAAIAVPRGAARRGVVRVSGAGAFEAVAARSGDAVFAARRAGRPTAVRARWVLALSDAPQALARLAAALGPAAEIDVDLWAFPAPRSYTGDDLVEVHAPGDPQTLDLILRGLLAAGARPAAAGEFTRRAAESGRLDLTRAEAVAALIRARDDAERRRALALLEGGLARETQAFVDRLVALLAPLE
ncbi:MAG TPA: hypothetical protein VEI02_01175, partial [Planctomycetota bacterium]|nr:hypothetical protein [Planctomycetota bacterium]